MSLLDKLRVLNKFMQKTAAETVDFDEICAVLSEIIDCSVYVLSRGGKLIGCSFSKSFECEKLEISEKDEVWIPEKQNRELVAVEESTRKKFEGECIFFSEESCLFAEKNLVIIPAYGGDNRMGTVILASMDNTFSAEDIILGEYGSTVVALEIIRSERKKKEEEMEKRFEVRVALNTLSFSELEVANHIFRKFEGGEQIMIMSEIADQAEISRSAAVNALHKLESAGIVESHSLGMKGTYIKLLNNRFLEELKKREEMEKI